MTPVRSILLVASFLNDKVVDGLGALDGVHRKFIDEMVRRDFGDSLEIDENLRVQRDQDNRWDYLLGHGPSKAVFGLEPHSATTGEVDTVIRKRVAALRQLRPHLKPGASIEAWFWVASGKVDFVPHERCVNRLAQSGIAFVGRKLLVRHLPKASSNRTTPRK